MSSENRASVDSAFAEFDANLNLDPAQRARAEERHHSIRDVLAAAGYVSSSFLQGSFARKTMLAPLKDVDIVVLLQDSYWDELKDSSGPATAMEWFRNDVRRVWPEAQFDAGPDGPSGKALRVSFPDLDFDIDLVPAFDLEDSNVLIGDRHLGHWEPSNTRRQRSAVATRNKTTNGRFVHQVRELKALVRNHKSKLDFVKGIVVESLAYAAVKTPLKDKLAIVDALHQATISVRGPVMEPAGDDDVTIKWSPAERAIAAEMSASFAERADEAVRLEADGDPEAAKDVWHSLFGDDFPEAETRSPETVLALWNTDGSRTSTGRTTVSTAGRQATHPGRAWAPR